MTMMLCKYKNNISEKSIPIIIPSNSIDFITPFDEYHCLISLKNGKEFKVEYSSLPPEDKYMQYFLKNELAPMATRPRPIP